MTLPSVYEKSVCIGLIDRLNKLESTTQPLWGKMNVAQMLAHCNVTYELDLENIHPKPGFLIRWMLKAFVKKGVVNEVPYAKNSRTAPVFLVSSEKDFDQEKQRLVEYINKVQQLGSSHFERRENPGFGKLTAIEWNNLFYKHLDHHFSQFGV